MVSRDYEWVKWAVPAALGIAWGIRLQMQPSWLAVGGLALLVLALTAYLGLRGEVRVFWDENNSIMVLVRTWTVEVCAGCLMTSVPLGLDLTYSAKQVLRAMGAHDEEDRLGGIEVRFFMTRPLGQGPTRLGMMAVRSTPRWTGGLSRARVLHDKLLDDVEVLESAMRSAYPHTPIERADLRDMALVNAGGFDVIAA